MRIKSFKIENFRNIRYAECENVPNFVVIAGPNGCGKSAILEALIMAKEGLRPYSGSYCDWSAITAGKESATVTFTISFSEEEKQFFLKNHNINLPSEKTGIVEFTKGQQIIKIRVGPDVERVLGYFNRTSNNYGVFDYIYSYQDIPKSALSQWDTNQVSQKELETTLAKPRGKFRLTKAYLASIKVRELTELQKSIKLEKPIVQDILNDIKEQFKGLFPNLEFDDVILGESPFRYIIKTKNGEIDIDDLSSGEKWLFHLITRFDQIKHKNSILLFDEADAHMHPELSRTFIKLLRKNSENNQIFLTTHSPEMIIEAGPDSLYTIVKDPPKEGFNQFIKVSSNEAQHAALSELMGSKGIISFNQKVIFIEGTDSSADKAIFERFYPPEKCNLTFVPIGEKSVVFSTAERVSALLDSSFSFQKYYCIIDKDLDSIELFPESDKLFKLPVYHIENFLLDETLIFEVCSELLRGNNPFSSPTEVENKLHVLLLDEQHLHPFTASLLNSRLSAYYYGAKEKIFKNQNVLAPNIDFNSIKPEAEQMINDALNDGTWKSICKGKDLLKAFCGEKDVSFGYEILRNALIAKLQKPPQELHKIMEKILSD